MLFEPLAVDRVVDKFHGSAYEDGQRVGNDIYYYSYYYD